MARQQIIKLYSDGHNGRCAVDVITSYYDWSSKDSQASGKLLCTLIALRHAEIDKNLLIELNDSGGSFDQIADYLHIAVNSVDMIESSM